MQFLDRMIERWCTELKLAKSPALIRGWMQLERAAHQIDNATTPWRVIQLPTGAGKTEALKVLCAVQQGAYSQGILAYGQGILIVTQFQTEADKIASDINVLAGKPVARSLHKLAPANGTDLTMFPVLVITHEAYRRALIELADFDYSPAMERFRYFHHVKRRWVFIDEQFDWVDAHNINLSELRSMSGDLYGRLTGQAQTDLALLLELVAELTGPECGDVADRPLPTNTFSRLASVQLEAIENAVREMTEADNNGASERRNRTMAARSRSRCGSDHGISKYCANCRPSCGSVMRGPAGAADGRCCTVHAR